MLYIFNYNGHRIIKVRLFGRRSRLTEIINVCCSLFHIKKPFLEIRQITLVPPYIDYDRHGSPVTKGADKGLAGFPDSQHPDLRLELKGRKQLFMLLCNAEKYMAEYPHKTGMGVSFCFKLRAYISDFV